MTVSHKIMKMLLTHRSIQVFVLIAVYLLAAPFLSLSVHQGIYTISLLIKDLLLWMLPVTVGFFIAHAIASFEKKAPLFVILLFVFEALSNSASVWYVYGCGQMTAGLVQTIMPQPVADTFTALWHSPFSRPTWWTADKGTFAGIAIGLIAALRFPLLQFAIKKGKEVAEKVLTRFFSRLIPLFILGFVAKMYQTQFFTESSAQYADFFLCLLIVMTVYIAFLFLLGSGFSLRTFFRHVKNLLPAGGTAFSTGCSLSTMPLTIEGASKNLDDPELAKAVIPATTNIQQIGDCIVQTFMCFLIYLHFNGHAPTLAVWIPFATVFVLARFATAAVLGGAIFIMLPIYEHYLGFTPEMIAIVLAFNVILDPLVTCSNVVANGALCRVFERVWQRVRKGVRAQTS